MARPVDGPAPPPESVPAKRPEDPSPPPDESYYWGDDESPRYELAQVFAVDRPVTLIHHGGEAVVFVDGIPRRLLRSGALESPPPPALAALPRRSYEYLRPLAYVEGHDEAHALVRWQPPRLRTGEREELLALTLGDERRWHVEPIGEVAPGVRAYHAPQMWWDGGVVGVVRYAIDDPDHDSSVEKLAELEEEPLRFEALHEDPGSLPEIPAGWTPRRFAAAPLGSFYALALPADPASAPQTAALLSWKSGATAPKVLRLSATAEAYPESIAVSSEQVLAFGPGRYLAVGAHDGLARVPVEAPVEAIDRAQLDDPEHWDKWRLRELWDDPKGTITGAAKTQEGALWIIIDGKFLLRQRSDGRWQPVRIPPPEPPTADAVVLGDGWIPYELDVSAEDDPRLLSLQYAANRLWLVASFGPLVTHFGGYLIVRRNVLYSAGVVRETTPPDELAGRGDWRRFADGASGRKPSQDCSRPAVVLGGETRSARLTPAERELLGQIRDEQHDEGLVEPLLYVGEEADGRRVLALQLDRSDDDDDRFARSMRSLRTVFGAELAADCRPRRWIHSVR